MPTLVRAVEDERDCLLAFLAEQRVAVCRAVHGLTDEQARVKPMRNSTMPMTASQITPLIVKAMATRAIQTESDPEHQGE